MPYDLYNGLKTHEKASKFVNYLRYSTQIESQVTMLYSIRYCLEKDDPKSLVLVSFNEEFISSLLQILNPEFRVDNARALKLEAWAVLVALTQNEEAVSKVLKNLFAKTAVKDYKPHFIGYA